MASRFRRTRSPEKRITLPPAAIAPADLGEPPTMPAGRPPGALLKAFLIYALTAVVPWIMLATIKDTKQVFSNFAIYICGWFFAEYATQMTIPAQYRPLIWPAFLIVAAGHGISVMRDHRKARGLI